jgi:tetratricopeptide (TPR) repeat protein
MSRIFESLLLIGCLLLLWACWHDPTAAKGAYLDSGQRYFDNGEYNNASIQFRKALQIDRGYAEAQYRLGLTELKLRLWPEALRSLSQAAQLDPKNVQPHLRLAELHLAARQWKEVREQVSQIFNLDPQNVDAYVLSGQVEFLDQHYQEALQALQRAEILAPNDARVQEELGNTYVVLQQFEKAARHYKRAIELDPNSLPSYLNLAQLYRLENQAREAVQLLHRAISTSPKVATPLIEKGPEQAHLYELLGDAYLSTNDLEAAERAYRAAIEHNKNAYAAHTQLARIYAQEQKLPQAVSEAQVAVQQRPDILLNYILLGTLYQRRGAIEQARATYGQALQRDPNFALALNNLAWLDCEHGGNLDVALGLAQRAKQNLPNNPDISDTLAWIEYRKGLYRAAAPLLRDALRQVPDSGLFQYHLGMVLLKEAKDTEAKPILSRALASKLSAADTEQARAALRQLDAH